MQVMTTTYHQCVMFPYNGTKICIPGDNTLSIYSISASPSLPLQDPIMQTSYTPLSLEVAPCQQDSQKDKHKNVKKDQDQAPRNLFQDVTPPYSMSYPPPMYDEDTTFTISLELTKNCEQNYVPILSKETC